MENASLPEGEEHRDRLGRLIEGEMESAVRELLEELAGNLGR